MSTTPDRDDPRRTLVRRARFSTAEWNSVLKLAKDSGKPPGTYLREAALGAVLRPRLSQLEMHAVYELARLGNNLNQIARRLNENDFTVVVDLDAPLDDLQKLLERLRR